MDETAIMRSTRRKRFCPQGVRAARFRGQRGAALVVAILVLAILTVIGIALMLITSTESRIAANEWSINRAFYATDSGIRWAAVQLTNPEPFLWRAEFGGQPPSPVIPFCGTGVNPACPSFPLPSWKGAGYFTGDVNPNGDIVVSVQTPSLVGRRPYEGGLLNQGAGLAQYMYSYEVRATGGESGATLQYSKSLVADVEVGPLPETVPF